MHTARWLGLLLLAAAVCAQEPPPSTQTPPPGAPEKPKLKRGPQSAPAPAAPQSESKPPVGVIEVDAQGRVVRREGKGMPVQDADLPASPPGSLIERARRMVFVIDSGLPGFICDVAVRRSESASNGVVWKKKDRLEAELVFDGVKEELLRLRRDGRPVAKEDPAKEGLWSSGEYGLFLPAVFHRGSRASFRESGRSTVSGREAVVFRYSVTQPRSRWTFRANHEIRPAFRGSVWIDPKTAEVLRIEAQAYDLPDSLDHDKAEVAIDYAAVPIGGVSYLLPVKAAALTCRRNTPECSRNETEFTNHKKFDASSSIRFDDDRLMPAPPGPGSLQ